MRKIPIHFCVNLTCLDAGFITRDGELFLISEPDEESEISFDNIEICSVIPEYEDANAWEVDAIYMEKDGKSHKLEQASSTYQAIFEWCERERDGYLLDCAERAEFEYDA